MFTDPKRIRLSDPGHPEECNVFSYYKAFIPDREVEVYDWCKNAQKGCTDCKLILAGDLIARLAMHQKNRTSWLENETELNKILKEGSQKASEIASQTIKEVKEIINIA